MLAARPVCHPTGEKCNINELGAMTSISTAAELATSDLAYNDNRAASLTSISLNGGSSPTLTSVWSSTSSITTATASTTTSPSSTTFVTSSTSSSAISWGPAVTASAYIAAPAAQEAAAATSPSASNKSGNLNSFTKGQKQATIATTVIAGVIIIALLIYALVWRRKGASVSKLVRLRHHRPSTILLSPTRSRERDLTALPIYREERFSVHSSRHASMVSWPRSLRKQAAYPQDVSQRFHALNPYVKNQWQTKIPPATPSTPLREGHSFLIDASPSRSTSEQPRAPQTAQIPTKALNSQQSPFPHEASSTDPTAKLGLSISIRETPSTTNSTTPETPSSLKSPLPNNDRWSWTNSQAPPTPRMYAPSLRSSISSMSKFRTIRSWVRGQSEQQRIDEERPPSSSAGKKKAMLLKNQASVPVLAPPPVAAKRREERRVGMPVQPRESVASSVASIFRQHPGSKVIPAQQQQQQQRRDDTKVMEMSERQQHRQQLK